jgi:transcription initiation factor TFIIB
METAKTSEACPDCRNEQLVTDLARGEVYCERCGSVIKSMISQDTSPSGHGKDSDSGGGNGDPPGELLADRGLSTVFDSRDRDGAGKILSPANQDKFRRLRWLDRRARYSHARGKSLAEGLALVGRLGETLGAPLPMRKEAALLYRRVNRANMIRGRTIRAVSATMYYMVYRRKGIPVSAIEISQATGIPAREVLRLSKVLRRRFGIVLPLFGPEHYLQRFADLLDIQGDPRLLAKALLRGSMQANGISQGTPHVVAAASLYLAGRITHRHVSQNEICRVAKISEVALRVRYRTMAERLAISMVARGILLEPVTPGVREAGKGRRFRPKIPEKTHQGSRRTRPGIRPADKFVQLQMG